MDLLALTYVGSQAGGAMENEEAGVSWRRAGEGRVTALRGH